ncbi:MAG: cytochrome P460, partial [Xanthobacteraceae bacterium]
MTRISSWLIVTIATVLAGGAISAQDKYTVQIPGGLAFSEFRGYEDWPVISTSDNGGKFAAILGNPVMMDALRAGVPGNG